MSQEQLKPCPFCGGRAEFNEHTPECYFSKLADVKKAPQGDVACMIDLIPAWNARAPATSVSDEQIDEHLDNILRAAGSALRYYTMQKSKDDMRAALRNAILALRPAQAGDQWREAVEEQFAVNHLDMPEDPREAIKKLIATEVRDALDPTISSAAAEIGKSMLPAEHTTDQ